MNDYNAEDEYDNIATKLKDAVNSNNFSIAVTQFWQLKQIQ